MHARHGRMLRTQVTGTLRAHVTDACYGRMLRTHVTDACYGRMLRAHATGARYGRTLRAHVTGARYGRTLRAHVTGARYVRTLRAHATVARYGRTLRSHVTVACYGRTLRAHVTGAAELTKFFRRYSRGSSQIAGGGEEKCPEGQRHRPPPPGPGVGPWVGPRVGHAARSSQCHKPGWFTSSVRVRHSSAGDDGGCSDGAGAGDRDSIPTPHPLSARASTHAARTTAAQRSETTRIAPYTTGTVCIQRHRRQLLLLTIICRYNAPISNAGSVEMLRAR